MDTAKAATILEWLVLNGDFLRGRIRSEVAFWIKDKPLYEGIAATFDAAYQDWLVKEVISYVAPGFQLSYEDAHAILDFPTLKAIWQLDEKGYSV